MRIFPVVATGSVRSWACRKAPQCRQTSSWLSLWFPSHTPGRKEGLRSNQSTWPITGQYSGHVMCFDKSDGISYIVCPGKRTVRPSVVETRPGKRRPAVGLLISLCNIPDLPIFIQLSNRIQLANLRCYVTIFLLSVIILIWRMSEVQAVKDFRLLLLLLLMLLCGSEVRSHQLWWSRLSLQQSPSLLVGTVQTFGLWLWNLKFNNEQLHISSKP